MMISATVLDETLAPIFEYHTEVDQLRLMILAESREDNVRQKGAQWAAGGVSHCGKEFINKFHASNEPAPDFEMEAANIALALWLYQSIFLGVKAESFMKTDLEFFITPDGIVQSNSHSSNFQ